MLKNIFVYLICLLLAFVGFYFILSLFTWDLFPFQYFEEQGMVGYRIVCFIVSVFLFCMEGVTDPIESLWREIIFKIEGLK